MNKLLGQDEDHVLSAGFVGIARQQRKDETLRFEDVTSSRTKSLSSLHPAMTQLTYPSSPIFSFSAVTSWKLEGNPGFEGSEGTQKWGRNSCNPVRSQEPGSQCPALAHMGSSSLCLLNETHVRTQQQEQTCRFPLSFCWEMTASQWNTLSKRYSS